MIPDTSWCCILSFLHLNEFLTFAGCGRDGQRLCAKREAFSRVAHIRFLNESASCEYAMRAVERLHVRELHIDAGTLSLRDAVRIGALSQLEALSLPDMALGSISHLTKPFRLSALRSLTLSCPADRVCANNLTRFSRLQMLRLTLVVQNLEEWPLPSVCKELLRLERLCVHIMPAPLQFVAIALHVDDTKTFERLSPHATHFELTQQNLRLLHTRFDWSPCRHASLKRIVLQSDLTTLELLQCISCLPFLHSMQLELLQHVHTMAETYGTASKDACEFDTLAALHKECPAAFSLRDFSLACDDTCMAWCMQRFPNVENVKWRWVRSASAPRTAHSVPATALEDIVCRALSRLQVVAETDWTWIYVLAAFRAPRLAHLLLQENRRCWASPPASLLAGLFDDDRDQQAARSSEYASVDIAPLTAFPSLETLDCVDVAVSRTSQMPVLPRLTRLSVGAEWLRPAISACYGEQLTLVVATPEHKA